jgi:hypothetical protein
MDFWDSFYTALGIKDFIYYISSSQLQDYLFPVKLVFLGFGVFFFCGIIYFMINSSWLQFKFLEETSEFFSSQSYGARVISKQWDKIMKHLDSDSEAEYKLAVIEADDFLKAVLDEWGYEGGTFEEMISSASQFFKDNKLQITTAHEVRNSIVYNPDLVITKEQAAGILDIYHKAITSLGLK